MGEGELREQSANPGSRGKMAVKMECVPYVSVYYVYGSMCFVVLVMLCIV